MNEIELLRKLAHTSPVEPPRVDVVSRVEASIAAQPPQAVGIWAACAGIAGVAAIVALGIAVAEWQTWPVSEFFEQIVMVTI